MRRRARPELNHREPTEPWRTGAEAATTASKSEYIYLLWTDPTKKWTTDLGPRSLCAVMNAPAHRKFPRACFAQAMLIVLVASGVAAQTPRLGNNSGGSLDTRAGMADVIRLFETDWRGLSRFHELPWSPARHERLSSFLQDWNSRLAGLDFSTLDQSGKVDYLLLRNWIHGTSEHLALEQTRLKEMEDLLPFRQAIQELELARRAFETVDPAAAASRLSAIPDQLKKLRQRIGRGHKTDSKKDATIKTEESDSTNEPPLQVSSNLARRAAEAAGEIRGTLRAWYGFYNGYKPDFSWWVSKPQSEAVSAIEDYEKYLREEIAGIKGKDEDPLLGEALGAGALADALATEMIPYSAAELIEIGEKEFAWCEERMQEAAKELGYGADWKAALQKVKSDFAPPGTQQELVVNEARAAIGFVKDRALVTIPEMCEETWRVTMISPEGQKTLPFAAYGGQNMMVAYPREEMKHDDKLMSMRGNNRHFTRIVTAHELIPGHHLQGFMAARLRPYRSMFSTPFLVEGWALYWEMTLWDLGFGGTPEQRIGMLFWRMHRCARIIVSLKFHLGQMKPEEMVTFLVDRVGNERFGATSEVRRFIGGNYSPLYQCGYMIGGMQLRALHKEAVGSGRWTTKQFNDAVLAEGPIPIEFIRSELLNVPLSRDTRSAWRFAAEKP